MWQGGSPRKRRALDDDADPLADVASALLLVGLLLVGGAFARVVVALVRSLTFMAAVLGLACVLAGPLTSAGRPRARTRGAELVLSP